MRDEMTIGRGGNRLAKAAVVGCLLVRALIPLGFMPGNALAGEFFVICPAGLPAAVAERLHLGHEQHSQTVVDVDRACPIGSALNVALPTTDTVDHEIELPLASVPGWQPTALIATPIRRHFLSRAPPQK